MIFLSPGANASIGDDDFSWSMETDRGALLGDYAGLALLPVDGKRIPCGSPVMFQSPQPWMEWSGGPEKACCKVTFGSLPQGCEKVLIVAYVYAAAGPISELGSVRLIVNDHIEHKHSLAGFGEAAVVLGEFYIRNSEWKFRALAEGSAYGLSALGRRLGRDIDDSHPNRGTSRTESSRSETATGTGFAVSPTHIMTCAHVIEGMSCVSIASFEGRYRAEPVVVDERNDIALLRIDGAKPLVPVTFREGRGCELGETVVALGYPLSGLAGRGLHVTQGGISALFGIRDDASLLQFTAAIQPGSSGSPLFDGSGLVVGLVKSSMADAQSMNFAVKSPLILAFLDASSINAQRGGSSQQRTTTEIAKDAQASLWRIEASAV
ncbi:MULTISPECIES: trypsin-like peptidase domain-containing protein [Pseudomonas]|uniref:Trypsin n=1 Tax=Pseudomonas neustonica TaxID=2487346 RepID=A0ABX9XF59_9PSED|nr:MULTISPECIES: trypsin-like peptidase domain-containing protein [Pseudomonas]MAB25223.1 trypsin [Pseudomonadales bacterium]MBF22634.1 trypsin [Pusillimonas sp.]MBA6419578.1 trypsin-like peptidase domain-containing protein [Pseudomonas sp. 5Ae-yellow]ROZ82491.1 trypsin [Pseudomonas neustonica]ROZ82562.1 trypsin [Pseudomonas sp. SSM44]|tara:strand:+ start:1812 stop:2948 length:1137 start_codon:yes stop_codon:yes gene_type:complete